MPRPSLHEVAAQLCAITGGGTPRITTGAGGVHNFCVTVSGVDFVFRHDPIEASRVLVIDVLFGVLPHAGDARALRELLLANRQLRRRADGPSFSCNPQSGEVVLRYVRAIAETTGEGLKAGLLAVAVTVLHWRKTSFLARQDGERSIDAPDVAGRSGKIANETQASAAQPA